MIKDIMSYRTKRMLNIAEHCLLCRDDFHINEIQKMNNCSIKTVYDDVYALMHMRDNILGIEFENKKCRSTKGSHGDLMIIKSDLMNQELLIQLLLNIYFHPCKNIIDHAIDLNYSESYIRTQINMLKKFLEYYNFSVIFNKSKNCYTLNTDNHFALKLFVSEIISLSSNDDILPQLEEDDYRRLEYIYQIYSKHLPCLVEEEIIRLYKVIKYNDSANMDQIAKMKIDDILKQDTSLLKQKLSEEIDNTLRFLEIEISPKSYCQLHDIFLLISIKAYLLPKKVDSYLNRYDYFYREFAEENPLYVKIFEDRLSNFSKAVKINYFEYRGEILFYLYNHIFELRKYAQYKVAVYSDLGTCHAKSLILSYKKHFPMHEFMPFEEFRNYDICLSTTSMPKFENYNRLVTISDYLNAEDLKNVYTEIYRKK